jgi:hypothetical protein
MKGVSLDKELESLGIVLHALESLNETQRLFVLKTAAERMQVKVVSPQLGSSHESHDANAPGHTNAATAADSGAAPNSQTPKQFLKAKLPKTDVLKVACLAYYLTTVRNKPHFKTIDLTKLNTEAGGAPLSNPSMAVANATRFNKYLSSVGKGNKQITALGEDVVVALPDEAAVKEALAHKPKPRKKRTKKARAKK